MCESAGLWKRLKENSTGHVCTGIADPQESTGRAGWLAEPTSPSKTWDLPSRLGALGTDF